MKRFKVASIVWLLGAALVLAPVAGFAGGRDRDEGWGDGGGQERSAPENRGGERAWGDGGRGGGREDSGRSYDGGRGAGLADGGTYGFGVSERADNPRVYGETHGNDQRYNRYQQPPAYSAGAQARGGQNYGRQDDGGRNWGLPNASANYGRGESRYDRHDNRQYYGYDYGRRPNDYRHGNGYGYGYGYDRHSSWRDRGWRVSWHHGWSGHRYRAPVRYYYPRGYSSRSWSIGIRIPRAYYAPTWYVDYRSYGLAAPPWGCQWVRVDGDVLLVDLDTGEIVDILYNFYY